MSTVLVMGANGFLGSRVTRQLVAGQRVVPPRLSRTS